MDSFLSGADLAFYERCSDKRQWYWNTQCRGGERGVFCGDAFVLSRDLTPDIKANTTHLDINTFGLRSPDVCLSMFSLGDLSEFTNLEFLRFVGKLDDVDFSGMDKLRVLVISSFQLVSNSMLNLPQNLETLIVEGTTWDAEQEARLGNLPQTLKKFVFSTSFGFIFQPVIDELVDIPALIPAECQCSILFVNRVFHF